MSEPNKPHGQEDPEEKIHGERSPSSLSMASGQSMKWDPTADFLQYSHMHVVQGTSQSLESSNERNESNPEMTSGIPSMARQSSSEIKTLYAHGRIANSPESDSSISQTKTYTLPGRSTPNESPAASLSFPSSPIPVDRRDVGINESGEPSVDVGKRVKNFQQQCDMQSLLAKTTDKLASMGVAGGQVLGRIVSDSSTDWEYGANRIDWQTLGLTRSELEYKNRKNNSSSTFENLSEIKLSMKTRVNNENENAREKNRRRAKGSNKHPGLLDEMREVDNKLRDILNQMRNQEGREHSGDIEESSSSGLSRMCRNARDYAKTMEKYLHKSDRSESSLLEERMQIYLRKIRDQIQLVEMYNRALIARQLKRSGSPKHRADRTQRKSHKNKNPLERDCEYRRSRKDEQRQKTNDSSKSVGTSRRSSGQFGAPSRHPNRRIRNENYDVARDNQNPDYLSSNEDFDSQNGFINPMPLEVSYERWTWPSNRGMPQSLYESPSIHHRTRGRAFEMGINEDGNRRRSHAQGNLALAQTTQYGGNFRHYNNSGRARDVCTSTNKPDKVDKEIQAVKPPTPIKPKKPVAFFVPLFCDDCDKPIETGSNKKRCHPCQEKYKWFCETKSKDELFDVKGPQKIQDCFKEAACSVNLVKRNNELLNSKFERMTMEDKICEGLVTEGFDRNQAEEFLREKCGYRGNDLENMLAYFDRYYHQRDNWSRQNPKKKPVISHQEMRERTARLRANDPVILERRRKEEEESRRATNRIMTRIYASNVRNQNIREERRRDPYRQR